MRGSLAPHLKGTVHPNLLCEASIEVEGGSFGANTLKLEVSITSLSIEQDLFISGSEMDLETPVHVPKTSESLVDSTTLKEDPKPEESAILNCNL